MVDEDFIEELFRQLDEAEAHEAELQRLATEEAIRDGKEPFDFEVFRKLYWRQGIMRSDMNSPTAEEAASSYEREYYLGFPQAKTMAEFARMLEQFDRELE